MNVLSLILAFTQNAVKGKADISVVNGKADKVSGGTANNVLVCNASGNPADSGYSIDDVITSGIFTGSLVNGELRITLNNE